MRYEPKGFAQRRPDVFGGWIWDLKDTPRVLYRLPELQGAGQVVIVEGEKDADALAALGFAATTSVMGAGKWKDFYAEQLRAASVPRVLIIPDNDTAGHAHAVQVAQSCRAHGLDARIVPLPGFPAPRPKHGEDVSDWLAGHTAEELRTLFAATLPLPDPRLGAASAAGDGHHAPDEGRAGTHLDLYSWEQLTAAPPAPIQYHWKGWVGLGAVALMVGAGESLKSWFSLYLAVMTAAGRPALSDVDEANLVTGPVLYFTAENAIAEEQRRAALLKGGLSLPDQLPLTFIAAERLCFSDPADFQAVRALVETVRPVALFIDSAIAISDLEDENSNAAVRKFMKERILLLARTYGATVYLIGHSGKPSLNPALRFSDEHVARGASDWRNSADMVLYLKRDVSLGKLAVVLKHSKCRIGPRHASLWFLLEDVEPGKSVRLVLGGTFDEDTGQGAVELCRAIRSAMDVLKAAPTGTALKPVLEQLGVAGTSKATARRALDVLRGKAAWPYGPHAGQGQSVVTESKSGRTVVLQFQPAPWLEPASAEADDDE